MPREFQCRSPVHHEGDGSHRRHADPVVYTTQTQTQDTTQTYTSIEEAIASEMNRTLRRATAGERDATTETAQGSPPTSSHQALVRGLGSSLDFQGARRRLVAMDGLKAMPIPRRRNSLDAQSFGEKSPTMRTEALITNIFTHLLCNACDDIANQWLTETL